MVGTFITRYSPSRSNVGLLFQPPRAADNVAAAAVAEPGKTCAKDVPQSLHFSASFTTR